MIGGKGNNRNQMYLAGLQAQSSVYGATIPVYYGTTRGNMLQTWLANLRQGASSKKGKKKGVATYVENTDFLIGHNPIAGVLQIWNNNAVSPLLFKKLSNVSIHFPFADVQGTYTIADPEFYFVIAVTANVALSGSFDDYGGQGTVDYDGTYELPLWNANYAGPNPTSQNGYRLFPNTYNWVPYSGNVITFSGWLNAGSPVGWNGTINVYYAALNPAETFSKTTGGSLVPLTNNRLSFEPQLGDGTEYTADGADKADQQIIYPEYAGAGSPNLDLGAAGAAPALLPEVVGMFSLWGPNGDADPSDMIEDIFMSGPAQAGTGAPVAYGDIHHGLGCLDFPGTIQKKVLYGSVEPWNESITFDLPNTAGNYLFCMLNQLGGGGAVSLSDTAGNTWTPVIGGAPSGIQLWYCVANDWSETHTELNTLTIANSNRFQDLTILELAGLDTLISVSTASGTGDAYSASATLTNNPGEPGLLFSFLATVAGTGNVTPPPFHWETIASNAADPNYTQVDQYSTKYPGTYTVSYSGMGAGAEWTGFLFAFKNSQPNSFTSPLGNIIDDTTMQQMRNQTRAYGLSGSLFMGSQKKASEWLQELYDLGNAAPVWAGFDLQSIPYAEQSYVGNGTVYVSPTASGPVLNITENDFAPGNGTDPPVTITRKAQVDTPNLQQIQFPNRASNYDQAVICEPDNGSMSLYGTRKDSPKVYQSVQTSLVARMLLGIMIRETNIVRNSYKFKLKANKAVLLLPMDLITIPIQSTMPTINQNQPLAGTIALRVLSIDIAADYTGDVECEPFIYGLRTPIPLTTTTAVPNTPNFGADPGVINPPIFMEAPPKLSGTNNLNDLWIIVSGSSPNYGGCIVNVSTDGGASYNPLGPNGGVVQGNATTGKLTSDWPAHADPDMADNLMVDLTESLGQLASYSVEDENNFVYPCYVAGGADGIAYELMAYAVANLTSAYNYELMATGTGNELRRAVWGIPTVGAGVDHPTNSRFAFLDPNNPNAAGILRIPLDPTWIGVTLMFKIQAFNTTGGNVESITDPALTVYSYTPSGNPGCVNSGGVTPGVFLVNGG